MAAPFKLRTIGFVESPFKEKFGTPRQPGLVANTIGRVTLCEDLNPDAFQGLSEFSHAWIVFLFHANDSFTSGKPFSKTKVHPPRLQGKSIGVFASRSPHRPNPIGLSLVRIEKIEGRTLTISGLDILDGTPVIDIKPYLPSIESPKEAKEGWTANVVEVSFEIFWSQRAKNDLYSLTPKLSDSERKVLMCGIEDILKLDPRPVAYRGTHENPNPYLSRYGFRFENWNVAFEIKTRSPLDLNDSGALQMAEITSIEKWSN